MADRVTVKVAGLSELGRRLSQLASDVGGRVARAAVAAGAQTIKRQAILNAPVATGNLKRNIITKRLRKSEHGLTEAQIVTVRQGRVTAKQADRGLRDAFYARYVEFGTVKTPARPFLRPAFDAKKEAAVDAMRERLAARITKAGG